MQLTPKVLEGIYITLYNCKPFCDWDLPLPEEIKFEVTNDPEFMGTYMYEDGEDYAHTITVSAARCGFLHTVITTMAHELIHMSRHNTITDAWTKHDATFRRRAHKVGAELGFDPLEL